MEVLNDGLTSGTFVPYRDSAVTFEVDGKDVLILDEKGMTYNGVFIEDAGEAHRVFLEVLYGIQRSNDGRERENNEANVGDVPVTRS